MKEIIDKSGDLEVDSVNNNLPLIYLFWIKIFFGIVGGINYYIIQRLFDIDRFSIHYFLRGLYIVGIFLILVLSIQLLIILLLYFSRMKFNKLVPRDEIIWRYSLRFSFIFIVVFLISASITFYIGF
jgi:hypothetical protein